jgi:hypothetical protein
VISLKRSHGISQVKIDLPKSSGRKITNDNQAYLLWSSSLLNKLFTEEVNPFQGVKHPPQLH